MRKSYIDCRPLSASLAAWCRDNSIPALFKFSSYGYANNRTFYYTTRDMVDPDFDRVRYFVVLIVREQDEALVRLWLGGDVCA